MKYISLLILTVFYLSDVYGQNVHVRVLKELNATLYTLSSKDTIAFIKADTNTVKRKPTLLFCQGSLPIPVVIYDKQYGYYFPLMNFDYRKLSGDYNVIIISMPHTPAVADVDQLNGRSMYVPDLSHPDLQDNYYLADNYLDKYVERANEVIDYVLSQPWADRDSLYVIGHSQGAAVSVGIARTNSKVKAIAYLSGNPDGRVTEKIKNIRRLLLQKEITPEDAQARLNELYAWWKDICNDKVSRGDSGDTPRTWQSFSVPLREMLVNLKIPVFIAYGVEDIGAASGCELMPVYFELNHKTDYQMYPVIGCGHNFEEFNSDGQPDYERMHWQEVMDRFIEYIK